MNEPLVSLIVPIYGVESYMEQCARSVLGQTYPSLECIFVNDGTKDRSMDVLSRVLEDFPGKCVKIVNKENFGLPLARKSGLEVATGEYILHVDADDWIEPDTVEKLVAEALRTGADLVYYDVQKEFGDRTRLNHEKPYTVADKAVWMKRLYHDAAYGYLCSKFARKKLYEGIFVPRFNMHEDIVFSTQLIFRAQTIAQLPLPLYHYRRTNPGAATRIAKARRRSQSARNMLDLYVNGGDEVKVVEKDLLGKCLRNALFYDRSIFSAYPFLREKVSPILRWLLPTA